MFKKRDRNEIRVIRHERVRKNISGTDTKGITLVSASTMDPALKGQLEEVDKKGAAKLVGKLIAERAAEKGVKTVVFDRGGYMYTGRVASVADGAREAGLEF